jgi:hypothetical protein
LLGEALADLGLKRVGVHALGPIYLPDFNVSQMHRTFYVGRRTPSKLQNQIDHRSRRCVAKLTLHIGLIALCPRLHGFSALTELIIGDTWRDFGNSYSTPLLLKGLETVAETLRHLTVSSSREKTRITLPPDLQLLSFICVCSGSLLLDCDAHSLSESLGDVLLGYTNIDGKGVRACGAPQPPFGLSGVGGARGQGTEAELAFHPGRLGGRVVA